MPRPHSFRSVLLSSLIVLLALFACHSPEQKLQKHLEVAQTKIEAGENEVARIELLNALKIDPGSSQAYFLMGKALAGMKNYQGAARALANANELAPDDKDIALEFARLLFAGRAYEMVEPILLEWAAKSPETQDFLIMLSVTQAQLGKASEAVKTARHVVDLSPDDPNVWLNLAQVYLMNRNQAMAEEALGKAEELDPGSVAVNLVRIDMLRSQGRFKEAVRNLETLSVANPDRRDLKVLLARRYESLGRKDDAIRLYREVLDPDPGAQVLHRLGLLLYETGEREEALVLWDRSVEVDPYFKESRLSIASHYLSQRDISTAREKVEEALKFATGDAEVLAMSGQIHMAQGQISKATADLKKAVDSRPDMDLWRLQLAQAQLAGSETTAARENLRTLLEKDPDHSMAGFLMAKIEANAGNLEESSQYARAVSDDKAVGREAMWILGGNALRQGMISEAKAIYERNSHRHGPHPGSRFWIARSKELLGDMKGAEEDYRHLFSERPGDLLPLVHLVSLLGRSGREDEALVLARENAEQGGVPQRLLLGRILEGTGNFSEAREVYLTLTEDQPDLMEPYQRVVALYARESKLAEAERWIAESLERSQNPPIRLLVFLGMVQDVLGEKKASMATYRKVLQIDPDFVPAMNNLAWNLAESGDLSEALKIAARAIKLAPNDPSLADTYAWILYKSGDSAGALPVLRQALERLPDNRTVRLHLVEVLKAVGRSEEAKRQFELLDQTR